MNILYLERNISRNFELYIPKSWDQGQDGFQHTNVAIALRLESMTTSYVKPQEA